MSVTSEKLKAFPLKGFMLVITLLMVGLTAFSFGQRSYAQEGATNKLVVLEAQWCAYCRELVPAFQGVAKSFPGLTFETINVDNPEGHQKAATYGISMQGGQLPRLFLVRGTQAQQLFDGTNYKWGQSQQVSDSVKAQLQKSLGK